MRSGCITFEVAAHRATVNELEIEASAAGAARAPFLKRQRDVTTFDHPGQGDRRSAPGWNWPAVLRPFLTLTGDAAPGLLQLKAVPQTQPAVWRVTRAFDAVTQVPHSVHVAYRLCGAVCSSSLRRGWVWIAALQHLRL